MATLPNYITIAFATLFVFCHVSTTIGDPNTNFISGSCNLNIYNNNDPYANSVVYVVADLETVTANSQNFDHYSSSPYANGAYGHATCNPALSYSDCTTCLTYAKNTVLSQCPNRIGGQITVQDCHMRYEPYSFSD